MRKRRARFQAAPQTRVHIDTHLAIQLIAQHALETAPTGDDEMHGAYRRRRVRSGIVADLQV